MHNVFHCRVGEFTAGKENIFKIERKAKDEILHQFNPCKTTSVHSNGFASGSEISKMAATNSKMVASESAAKKRPSGSDDTESPEVKRTCLSNGETTTNNGQWPLSNGINDVTDNTVKGGAFSSISGPSKTSSPTKAGGNLNAAFMAGLANAGQSANNDDEVMKQRGS